MAIMILQMSLFDTFSVFFFCNLTTSGNNNAEKGNGGAVISYLAVKGMVDFVCEEDLEERIWIDLWSEEKRRFGEGGGGAF